MGRLGDDILSATEKGKWVSFVFYNPNTGEGYAQARMDRAP